MADLEVNNHFGANGELGASPDWVFLPVFGIVHLTNCSACHEYMIHVAFAHQQHHITSFKNALKDSENLLPKHEAFLEGFRIGLQHRQGSYAPVSTHDREESHEDSASIGQTPEEESVDHGAEPDRDPKSAEHSGETQETAEDGVPAREEQDDGSKSTEQPVRAGKGDAPVPEAHHETQGDDLESAGQSVKATKGDALVPDAHHEKQGGGSKSAGLPVETTEGDASVHHDRGLKGPEQSREAQETAKGGVPASGGHHERRDDGSKNTEPSRKRPKDDTPVPGAHQENRDDGSTTGVEQPKKKIKGDTSVPDAHHVSPSTPGAKPSLKLK